MPEPEISEIAGQGRNLSRRWFFAVHGMAVIAMTSTKLTMDSLPVFRSRHRVRRAVEPVASSRFYRLHILPELSD
jgi:hypothetical protein